MPSSNGQSHLVALPIQKRMLHWQLPAPAFEMRHSDSPARVNLLRKAQDNHAVLLASLGFSYDVIQEHTGLSKSQIALRLRRAGVSASHYRNGRSIVSQIVIDNAAKKVSRVLNEGLHQIELAKPAPLLTDAHQ